MSLGHCYGSKGWADSILRIALKDVWGRGSRSLGARWQVILYARDELKVFKFPWHTRILNFQIHRAQKNGLLSLQSPENPAGSLVSHSPETDPHHSNDGMGGVS